MAAGSSYSNLSDEYHDFPCFLCEKDGRNISAVKFCVNCNHLLCSICLGHHNKFDIMKGHQILDKTAICRQRVKGRPAIPTLRCEKHDGKILDMFCRTHDEPCCVVCASVEHGTCTEKDYLPDIARNFKDTEFETLQTSANDIKHKLEKTKKERDAALKAMTDQRSSILVAINEKRDAINERIDAIENDVKMKLDKKFKECSSELMADIENVEEYVREVEEYREKSCLSQQNDSDAFIITKKLKQRVEKCPQYEKSLCSKNRSLKLIEKRSLSNILEAIGSDIFGYVSGDGEIDFIVEDAKYNIKAHDDANVSCISDSCLLKDGSIILTDQNNRKLKRLDSSFQLKDTLALPGKPCAVCPTDTGEIAVSLLSNKSIQFVSIANRMSVTNKFSIKESCRGIAYCNNQLYLSCGGMFKYHDGPGEIRIYDKAGKMMGKTDIGVGIPKRISIETDKLPSNMYIADEEEGVLALNTSEKGIEIRNIFKHGDMKAPVGMCSTGRGQIVVSGYDSNNVMLISDTGTMIKELMSQEHGIVKPKAVCVDQTGYKLMVCMADVDFIKVMHLVRK